MVIHAISGESGVLEKIVIDPQIECNYVKSIELAVEPGDYVRPFTGVDMALGDTFLRFDSREELDEIVNNSEMWLHIYLV